MKLTMRGFSNEIESIPTNTLLTNNSPTPTLLQQQHLCSTMQPADLEDDENQGSGTPAGTSLSYHRSGECQSQKTSSKAKNIKTSTLPLIVQPMQSTLQV
ncbi:hypothetical protein M758_10G040800 [Ceratodon purpureus]|nr:hypothetical protein M758_10G040800 [Ceratodon purpureus]